MQHENCEPLVEQKNVVKFLFGILIFLRLMLSSRLPPFIIPNSPHDDGWVVQQASYILNGKWFGPYDQLTLIKGPFSPLFLAFTAQAGISFHSLNTWLYCFSCLLFVISVRPLIKNHWLQLFGFAVLLFNPLVYAVETGQRIYRNSMGQWQILIIFGCLIAIFLRRNEHWKSLLKWEILCGLALAAFLNTREDGTWIYPFVLGSIFATIIAVLLKKEGSKKKIIFCALPLMTVWIVNCAFAALNYYCYRAPVINDRNGGNFAKVAGDLYAIAPDENDDKLYGSEASSSFYYTIYVSTMEKAIAASPTLKKIADPIRASIKLWETLEDVKRGQISTDHMLFAVRDAVREAGYYRSLPETEALYGQIHEELKLAFENGTLTKQGLAVSPMIKRLKARDFGKALTLMPRAISDVVHFKHVRTDVVPASGPALGIEKFSLLAGGDILKSLTSIGGLGWAFLEDDKDRLQGGLYDKNGALIEPLSFKGGEDVFNAYKFQNAKVSRFSFDIKGYDHKSGVTFRFFNKNKELVWEQPLNGVTSCGGKEGAFRYCIDDLTSNLSTEMFYLRLVNRANKVIGLYQKLCSAFGALAVLIYLAITIQVIREVRKKQLLATLPAWLLLTGIGSTFILFMFAMCLITVVSFNALIYPYAAPAYVLFLMFSVVSAGWGMQVLCDFKKRKQS